MTKPRVDGEIVELFVAARIEAGYDTPRAMALALADALGTFDTAPTRHLTTILAIESGQRSPTIATLERLFVPLGWDVIVDAGSLSIRLRRRARGKSVIETQREKLRGGNAAP